MFGNKNVKKSQASEVKSSTESTVPSPPPPPPPMPAALTAKKTVALDEKAKQENTRIVTPNRSSLQGEDLAEQRTKLKPIPTPAVQESPVETPSEPASDDVAEIALVATPAVTTEEATAAPVVEQAVDGSPANGSVDGKEVTAPVTAPAPQEAPGSTWFVGRLYNYVMGPSAPKTVPQETPMEATAAVAPAKVEATKAAPVTATEKTAEVPAPPQADFGPPCVTEPAKEESKSAAETVAAPAATATPVEKSWFWGSSTPAVEATPPVVEEKKDAPVTEEKPIEAAAIVESAKVEAVAPPAKTSWFGWRTSTSTVAAPAVEANPPVIEEKKDASSSKEEKPVEAAAIVEPAKADEVSSPEPAKAEQPAAPNSEPAKDVAVAPAVAEKPASKSSKSWFFG